MLLTTMFVSRIPWKLADGILDSKLGREEEGDLEGGYQSQVLSRGIVTL